VRRAPRRHRAARVLAERIPGARLQVFEGGHIFMIQDPTAFPAIIEFLTDIPRL
jgi:3-oxoadipate enol-lactonase